MRQKQSAAGKKDENEAMPAHVLDEPMRLLVVDDDPVLREFAATYLGTPFAEIVTTPTADRALLRLRNEKFDLVIADVAMPGMNGIDMVAAMRREPRLAGIPVIMLTGHDDVKTIDDAFRAGATAFATKPVNWRLLSYHIKYVLRAHTLLRGVAANA